MRWEGRWDEDIESANLAPQSDVAVETPLVATSHDDLTQIRRLEVVSGMQSASIMPVGSWMTWS